MEAFRHTFPSAQAIIRGVIIVGLNSWRPRDYSKSLPWGGRQVFLSSDQMRRWFDCELVIIMPHYRRALSLVPDTYLMQSIFNQFHSLQSPFFFQSSSNDLNTNRQPNHLLDLVVLVRAFLDMISRFEVFGQGIFTRINLSHWDDASGVIDQVE